MWKGEEDLRELGGEDCNQNILSEKNPSSIKKKSQIGLRWAVPPVQYDCDHRIY